MANDSKYRKRVEFEQFRKKIEAAEGPGRSVKPKHLQPVSAQVLIERGFVQAS